MSSLNAWECTGCRDTGTFSVRGVAVVCPCPSGTTYRLDQEHRRGEHEQPVSGCPECPLPALLVKVLAERFPPAEQVAAEARATLGPDDPCGSPGCLHSRRNHVRHSGPCTFRDCLCTLWTEPWTGR